MEKRGWIIIAIIALLLIVGWRFLIKDNSVTVIDNISEEELERQLLEREAKEECDALEGELIEAMIPGEWDCKHPTSDGGNPCSGSEDCEEECVAPENCEAGETGVEGTCAEETQMIRNGVSIVENGVCMGTVIA